MRKLFIFLLMAMAMLFIVQSSFAGDDVYNDGFWKVTSTGVLTRESSTASIRPPYEIFTTGDTLTVADSGKYIITNLNDADGIVDFVLPSAATAGLEFKFVSSKKSIIRIDPSSSQQINYAALAGGDRIASGTAAAADGASGDSITLLSDGTGWLVTEMCPIDWADAD